VKEVKEQVSIRTPDFVASKGTKSGEQLLLIHNPQQHTTSAGNRDAGKEGRVWTPKHLHNKNKQKLHC